MKFLAFSLAVLGASAASASSASSPSALEGAASPRGNLRRRLRDDSMHPVTTTYKSLAAVTVTTKNDWNEEGVHYVHIRARFNNVDKQDRPICGITFSIEGFDPSDPRAQYGNFEVLSGNKLFMPGSTESSNPLHYHALSADTRPDWFIGAIFPFSSTDHEFPEVAITDVQLCTAAPAAAAPATTTTTTATKKETAAP